MISDKSLLRIALVSTILGLGTIYISSLLIEPVQLSPANVSSTHIGETVVVTGTIPQVTRSDPHTFFQVTQNNASIPAVWFHATQPVPTGQPVQARGTVKLYKGELELVVDAVTVKNTVDDQR